MQLVLRRWLLASSLALTACAGTAGTAPPARQEADGIASARRPAAAAVMKGRVMAPPNVLAGTRLIGTDGASLIGADGASLVGTDGASLIGLDGASFRLLAMAERGLARAEVALVDAGGKPVPGVKPVLTDGEGRYQLAGVPASGVFRVVAGVRTAAGPARLEALVRPGAAAAADVSAATTLVTAVLAGGARPEAFDATRFADAVAACRAALADGALPEWSSRDGVDRAARAMMAEVPAMRPALEALARDMGAGLASAAPSVAPAPADAASAAATSPTPAVSPSDVASVAPTPSGAAPSAAPTPRSFEPVVEVHDPRAEFHHLEDATSPWSYWWLDGLTPRPMVPGTDQSPIWSGGSGDPATSTPGDCFASIDATSLVLDPSTFKLEGVGARWLAPVRGTVRVAGIAEINAHTTNGVKVSVRRDREAMFEVDLGVDRTQVKFDTGTFDVEASAPVWLWTQPKAMPETTDVTRFRVELIFTRPGG